MNRYTILAPLAALAMVPAGYAAQAATDDGGRAAVTHTSSRHGEPEPGDDHGRHGTHHRAGHRHADAHHHGRHHAETEPGDDNGGSGTEAGDDNGGDDGGHHGGDDD